MKSITALAAALLLSGAAGAQDFDSLVPGATAARPPSARGAMDPSSRPTQPARSTAPGTSAPRAVQPPPPRSREDASEPSPSAPVNVRTFVDRTAAWVGEPLLFSIEVTCPPGSDILQADVARDRLRLTGLEVQDFTTTREAAPDGTLTYRAAFTLAGFTLDQPLATIEPQAIRYYVHTAGQPTEALTPADEIEVPGMTVALRSVLPDANVTWLRDQRRGVALPAWAGFAMPVGVGVFLLATLPLGFVIVTRLTRTGFRKAQPVIRRRRGAMESLESLRSNVALDSPHGRREAFGRLGAVIRGRLEEEGLPACSLTSDELREAMTTRKSPRPVDEIAAMLRVCDEVSYGPVDLTPGEAEVTLAIDRAARALGTKGR